MVPAFEAPEYGTAGSGNDQVRLRSSAAWAGICARIFRARHANGARRCRSQWHRRGVHARHLQGCARCRQHLQIGPPRHVPVFSLRHVADGRRPPRRNRSFRYIEISTHHILCYSVAAGIIHNKQPAVGTNGMTASMTAARRGVSILLLCLAFASVAAARNVALLVAVGQFRDPALKTFELRGTAVDIDSVQQTLTGAVGVRAGRRRTLRDSEATHERILAEIAAPRAAQRAGRHRAHLFQRPRHQRQRRREQLRPALCDRRVGALRPGLQFDARRARNA